MAQSPSCDLSTSALGHVASKTVQTARHRGPTVSTQYLVVSHMKCTATFGPCSDSYPDDIGLAVLQAISQVPDNHQLLPPECRVTQTPSIRRRRLPAPGLSPPDPSEGIKDNRSFQSGCLLGIPHWQRQCSHPGRFQMTLSAVPVLTLA